MGFFSRLFGTDKHTPDAAPEVSVTAPALSLAPDESDAAHERWYIPAGTDESVFVGADGSPALHLIDYTDSYGERILRLVDDRTGLLIGPTDRRLPKLGIWVGQLRGEYYNKAGCKAGDFSPGAAVTLTPEPTNEHDPNAVAVHDGTGQHRAGYFNKQKARAVKRAIDNGTQLAAISLRGTGAGQPCEDVAVIAAAPEVLARLVEPRSDKLPIPAHLR